MSFRLNLPVMPCLVRSTILSAALGWGGSTLAAEFPHGFERIVLSDKYLCDGINTGDFNRDGVIDIVAGPYWYEGPGFKVRHEIFPAVPLDPKGGASNCMQVFVHDFNGDGRPDVLMLGRARFPDGYKPQGWEKVVVHDAFWYENPGDGSGPWEKHFVFPRAMGESPVFADADGDGKPELFCLWDKHWGMLRPDPADARAAWKFTPITRENDWPVYYHGSGLGDINQDGRPDLILNDGWWEQPAKSGDEWREHTFRFSKERGGAQMYAYDIDGDGDNDVITSLDGHGWGMSWFEQVKEAGEITFREHRIMGTAAERPVFGIAISEPHSLAIADLDGDGLTDVITGKRIWAHGPEKDPEPGSPPVVYWFRLVRDKTGAHFEPHLIDDNSGIGAQIIVRDMNGDGAPDVLSASKLGTFLFLNRLRAAPQAAKR